MIGTAVATLKHPTMQGTKLLVVQPYLTDGKTPDADPQVCIDAAGAGIGQRVLISSDGKFAKEILKSDATPVRWTIIGIEDDRMDYRPDQRKSVKR